MADYRDDDQNVGYCPKCGSRLSTVNVNAIGYCGIHGWVAAEWTRPYSRATVEAWAHDHDEYEYLRMEEKLDRAGEA